MGKNLRLFWRTNPSGKPIGYFLNQWFWGSEIMNHHSLIKFGIFWGGLISLSLLASTVQAQYVVRPEDKSLDLLNNYQGANVVSPLQTPDPVSPQYPDRGGYPIWPGYNFDIYGLQGASMVIEARGQYLMDSEWARILREQANQANLQTQKAKFDLERYIKENTPTWSDEQKKILDNRLQRIRESASPGEIFSGEALNLLLEDLQTKQIAKVAVENMPHLSKEVLGHLNVTAGNNGNLGLLMGFLTGHDDAFVWPAALQKVIPEEERDKITKNDKALVGAADNGKVLPNLYSELRMDVSKMREKLKKQILEVPADQYLRAKRFLNEFQYALLALQNPTVVQKIRQFQEFASKERSVEELYHFMNSNGLRFTDATQGSEFAYRAAYGSMASYNVVFNVALGGPGK